MFIVISDACIFEIFILDLTNYFFAQYNNIYPDRPCITQIKLIETIRGHSVFFYNLFR